MYVTVKVVYNITAASVILYDMLHHLEKRYPGQVRITLDIQV